MAEKLLEPVEDQSISARAMINPHAGPGNKFTCVFVAIPIATCL